MQDSSGDFIHVVTCGTLSQTSEIKNGNEVLLFFLKTRATLPDENATTSYAQKMITIWMYDDAFLYLLKRSVRVKDIITDIKFQL